MQYYRIPRLLIYGEIGAAGDTRAVKQSPIQRNFQPVFLGRGF